MYTVFMQKTIKKLYYPSVVFKLYYPSVVFKVSSFVKTLHLTDLTS